MAVSSPVGAPGACKSEIPHEERDRGPSEDAVLIQAESEQIGDEPLRGALRQLGTLYQRQFDAVAGVNNSVQTADLKAGPRSSRATSAPRSRECAVRDTTRAPISRTQRPLLRARVSARARK